MKQNLLAIFLLVAGSLHVVGQTPAKVSTKNDKIEQEVRKAIKDFDDASERGDVAKLEALIKRHAHWKAIRVFSGRIVTGPQR